MTLLIQLILLASITHASSWFSEPEYTKWSRAELSTWLEQHDVRVPPSFDTPQLFDLVDANWHSLPSSLAAHANSGRQWSLDQFTRAQHAFQHIKEDTFDQWDESKLRAFLLEHGVVAPAGPREQLVLLAKNKYRAYTDAAAFYSSAASGSMSSAHASASNAANTISQSISSVAAQATEEVARKLDETRDYVYSTWDDNGLREWLRDRGVVEAENAHSKDDLTRVADDYYRKATSAVWERWSDSYIREWLISHNLLKPSETHSRLSLLGEMKKYYYKCSDYVWDTWSDSESKSWLVDHGILKSDAQKSRDELAKMVEEHYHSASDSIWGAWRDSDIRQWLSENGHLEGRSSLNDRQDLVNLINTKYPDASAKVESYLVWPDARLRAYLRERGVGENMLPTSRPGLLQETRIRWVQISGRSENVFAKIKEIVNSSVEAVEDKIARVLEVLSGRSRDAACDCAETKSHVWSWGSHKVDEVRETAERAHEKGAEAVDHARQGGEWAREKTRGDEL